MFSLVFANFVYFRFFPFLCFLFISFRSVPLLPVLVYVRQLACSPMKSSTSAPGVTSHAAATRGLQEADEASANRREGSGDTAATQGGGGESPQSDEDEPPRRQRTLKRQLTKHVVTRWYRAPELILLQVSGMKAMCTPPHPFPLYPLLSTPTSHPSPLRSTAHPFPFPPSPFTPLSEVNIAPSYVFWGPFFAFKTRELM